MKPHVNRVISIWRDSLANPPEKIAPYGLSDQLRSLAALFTPGLFYYYILNFPKLKMEFVHEGTKELLGLEPEEVTIEKLVELLTPDERQPMAQKESVVVDFFINFVDPKEVLDYKSAYFFSLEDISGEKHEMLHQASILTVTEDNQPQHVMVVHTDVSHLNFVRKNSLSLINLRGKKSYLDIDATSGKFIPEKAELKNRPYKDFLTRREKQVIQLIAQGCHSERISAELNISIHTLRTHRKNILKKTSCKTITELVANCLIEGVI